MLFWAFQMCWLGDNVVLKFVIWLLLIHEECELKMFSIFLEKTSFKSKEHCAAFIKTNSLAKENDQWHNGQVYRQVSVWCLSRGSDHTINHGQRSDSPDSLDSHYLHDSPDLPKISLTLLIPLLHLTHSVWLCFRLLGWRFVGIQPFQMNMSRAWQIKI